MRIVNKKIRDRNGFKDDFEKLSCASFAPD